MCEIVTHDQSKVWTTYEFNVILVTLQFLTDGIKATYEHAWNYVGTNTSVK